MAVSRGVLYVAVGKPRFREYAVASMATLRKQGYDGRIAVVSDAPINAYGCETVRVSPGERMLSRRIKTDLPRYSPFDETLYLDCDTLVLRWPAEAMWAHLDGADLGMCIDVHSTLAEALRKAPAENRGSPEERQFMASYQSDRTYFNSGVILWRRSAAMDQFFALWREEWLRFGQIDQFALARTMQRMAMPIRVLGHEFNVPSGVFKNALSAIRAGVCILHFFTKEEQRRLQQASEEVLFDLHTRQRPTFE